MSTITTDDELAKLDAIIVRVMDSMANHEPHSAEYRAMATHLSTLTKARETLVNIELKKSEAERQQEESNRNHSLKEEEARHAQALRDAELRIKEEELRIKQAESENLQAQREEELRIKQAESQMRREETDATTKLREAETEAKKDEVRNRGKVSKETWALIGANVLGIVLVLGYEHTNVLTSKAFGLVRRLK